MLKNNVGGEEEEEERMAKIWKIKVERKDFALKKKLRFFFFNFYTNLPNKFCQRNETCENSIWENGTL